MPMSKEAFAGLRAAIKWNRDGGLMLLSALREMPEAVKYKDDHPYGPIHFVLGASLYHSPLPEEELPLCKAFGDEWLQRQFTKRELADAVERILKERGTIG